MDRTDVTRFTRVTAREGRTAVAPTATHLWLQLGTAAGLGLLMTVTHTLGLLGIARALRLKGRQLAPHAMDTRSVMLIGTLGLLLATLHIFEIVLFALLYLLVGAMGTFEDALYHSATAYSTLGMADGAFPREWRLVGAFEGLAGFVLIGWSTAFMVSTMNKLSE